MMRTSEEAGEGVIMLSGILTVLIVGTLAGSIETAPGSGCYGAPCYQRYSGYYGACSGCGGYGAYGGCGGYRGYAGCGGYGGCDNYGWCGGYGGYGAYGWSGR